MSTKRNPQEWLPIGQRVSVNAPAPIAYNEAGEPMRLYAGVIVEHLTNGAVAVLFDHYPHAWDYSAREACGFSKQYDTRPLRLTGRLGVVPLGSLSLREGVTCCSISRFNKGEKS